MRRVWMRTVAANYKMTHLCDQVVQWPDHLRVQIAVVLGL